MYLLNDTLSSSKISELKLKLQVEMKTKIENKQTKFKLQNKVIKTIITLKDNQ